MFRDRTEQLNYIQHKLIVYVYRKDKSDNFIPVGTGFFIDSDGTIMTAKHNIDFSMKCSFCILYNGKYYKIKKKQNVNYKYNGVDIIVVQVDISLNISPCDFFIENTRKEELLISEEVIVVGYENKGKKLLTTTGTICGISNGKYEIQNANVGSGNSGAPVILKKDLKTLIGVMSKRENLMLDLTNYKIKSDKFGIGYAHSINLFNEKCNIDISGRNNKFCNLLNTKPINEWEDYFAYHVNKVNVEYRKTPNPIYIYNHYFKNYKIESINIAQLCEFMICNKLFLYNMGRLYEFIGNILINSGIIIVMTDARYYLKIANLIYENIKYSIGEVIKRKIKVNWLISITYKLERNYGEAINVCEETILTFKKECKKFQIYYDEGLILPEREIAVIEQQKGYFNMLKQKDYLYETNIMETFFTNRRIFEFFLHKNDISKAKKVLPDIVDSYEHCKYRLEPIYKFTFAKNLYHYYALLNKNKKAEKYYAYAMHNFERWELVGQRKAILKLQDNLSN